MLLTEKQICEELQIGRQTLRDWRKRGMPYLKPDRIVRYNYDDVLEWMGNNTERED